MAVNRRVDFLWVAGDPALDFLNTTPVLPSGSVELLGSPADLVAWWSQSGLTDDLAISALEAAFASKPTDAQSALVSVRSLREAWREVVFAIESCDATPPDRAMRLINHALRIAAGHSVLTWDASSRRLLRTATREAESHPADLPLAWLAVAIEQFVATCNSSRIKKCHNPACVLHFYDTSKNNSRRWCSMDACGNRAKAAAFYARRRDPT